MKIKIRNSKNEIKTTILLTIQILFIFIAVLINTFMKKNKRRVFIAHDNISASILSFNIYLGITSEFNFHLYNDNIVEGYINLIIKSVNINFLEKCKDEDLLNLYLKGLIK